MMGMRENQKLQSKKDERGMAAILIAVIMMLVISIIVLAFAQVVRREQRNSLDNQLSTQAYYAAESGVNLAQAKLKATPSLGEKLNCVADVNFPDYIVGENAEITCLLLKKKLATLEYQNVSMYSVPMLIQADGGAGISEITFSWESPTSTSLSGCAGADGAFPSTPASGGNCQPVLRLDLLPVPSGGFANTASAAAAQFTTFLYPVTSSGSAIAYAPGSLNTINNVQCTSGGGAKKCSATVAVNGMNQYAARVMSLYGESNLTVTAKTSVGSAAVLVNGQVLIDVTAKASDVLKRVQARMSLSSPVPDFGATAGGDGVCKRYQKIGDDVSILGASYTACNVP